MPCHRYPPARQGLEIERRRAMALMAAFRAGELEPPPLSREKAGDAEFVRAATRLASHTDGSGRHWGGAHTRAWLARRGGDGHALIQRTIDTVVGGGQWVDEQWQPLASLFARPSAWTAALANETLGIWGDSTLRGIEHALRNGTHPWRTRLPFPSAAALTWLGYVYG